MKTLLLAASVLALSTAPALAAPSAPAAPPTPAVASAPAAPSFYRLEVSISDGTKPTPDTYSMVLEENQHGRLQTGENVSLGGGANGGMARQAIGLELGFSYTMRGAVLVLDGEVEMSSLDPTTVASGAPTFRRLKAVLVAPVVPGTPTQFVSLYDVSTKHRFEVTVSAKRLM